MDRAAIGDGGTRHRGAVQRQRLEGIHRELAVVEGRAVDRAVAGDMHCPAVGDRAAGHAGAVKRQRRSAVDRDRATAVGDRRACVEREDARGDHLDQMIVGDAHIIQRRPLGGLDCKRAGGPYRQRTSGDGRAIVQHQRSCCSGDVDLNGARSGDADAIQRRARRGFNLHRAGIGKRAAGDRGATLERQRLGGIHR